MREKTYRRLAVLIPESRRSGPRITQDVWDKLDPSERVQELTGQSLDGCREILDLPLEMAIQSPNVMQGKVQIIRSILAVVTKVGLESTRLRQMQEEVLGNLIEDFDMEERVRKDARAHRDDLTL